MQPQADHCMCAQEAMHNGPREQLIYVPAIIPDRSRSDYLATVDVDPSSETYSQACLRSTAYIAVCTEDKGSDSQPATT